MMPDYQVYVQSCGRPKWPRFVIRNDRGQLWTGDGWTTKPRDSLLFNFDAEASQKVTELRPSSTERHVVMRVHISVEREQSFSIAELREFFACNFQGFHLKEDFDGAMFDVQPDWDDLREIE